MKLLSTLDGLHLKLWHTGLTLFQFFCRTWLERTDNGSSSWSAEVHPRLYQWTSQLGWLSMASFWLKLLLTLLRASAKFQKSSQCPPIIQFYFILYAVGPDLLNCCYLPYVHKHLDSAAQEPQPWATRHEGQPGDYMRFSGLKVFKAKECIDALDWRVWNHQLSLMHNSQMPNDCCSDWQETENNVTVATQRDKLSCTPRHRWLWHCQNSNLGNKMNVCSPSGYLFLEYTLSPSVWKPSFKLAWNVRPLWLCFNHKSVNSLTWSGIIQD